MKSARMDGDFGVGPEGRGERTPSLPPPPPASLPKGGQGGHGSRSWSDERGGELGSEWNPVERSGVHTGVCRVPDPRPSPYTLHRGPVDGGPVHRKIRPPGASRRRATDNHVTLLLYRYRSRRHNTAPRTVPPRRYAPLGRREGGGRGEEKGGERKKKSSSILVTNRFDIFLLLFIQLNTGCPRARKPRLDSRRMEEDRPDYGVAKAAFIFSSFFVSSIDDKGGGRDERR